MKNLPLITDQMAKLRAAHPSITDAQSATAVNVGQSYEAEYGQALVYVGGEGALIVAGCEKPLGYTNAYLTLTQRAMTHVMPDGTKTKPWR